MIDRILLTKFDETLIFNSEFVHLTDRSFMVVGGYIGNHGICTDFIDLKSVSTTHNVILCRSCKLRIVIPKEIETYGDLRRYCAKSVLKEETDFQILSYLLSRKRKLD